MEVKLFIARLRSLKSLTTKPNIEQLLVELDGCHIRTGILLPVEKAEVTKKRRLLKRKRESDWKEVRVGLVRPVSDKEKRTYVARMSKYPEVVGQLVSAAYDQGMSKQTQVYAVADGGNGRSRCTSSTVSEFNIYPRPPRSQTTSLHRRGSNGAYRR